MRFIIPIVIVLFISVQTVQAQFLKEAELKMMKPVAEKSLVTLSKLVSEKNFKRMGFESVKEVQSAELGVPIKEYLVRLDQLREYEPGKDPSNFLTETGIVHYPVTVNKNVRLSVTLTGNKGEWQAVSYGSSNFSKLYNRVRQENSKSSGVSESSYFLVRVAALNLFFLGYYDSDKLMLVPIIDDEGFGFKAGRSLLAKGVFETLTKEARSHDGLPR